MITTIKSKKFILRPFKKGDEFSLAKNINNKKVIKNLLVVPSPYKLKDAQNWVVKNLSEYKKKEPAMIGFAIDIGGEVVGSVGVHKIVKSHQAEIGYWLAEQHWGNGIMTEAVKLITKFSFNELKLERVYAYAFSFNKASQKVLAKAGFKFEGILKKNSKKGDKFIDDYLFAKIRT